MKNYKPETGWQPAVTPERYLVFSGSKIIHEEGAFLWSDIDHLPTGKPIIVGYFKGAAVAAAQIHEEVHGTQITEGRALLTLEDSSVSAMYAHASQIIRSRLDHRYCGRCGRCGSECSQKEGEWAMLCQQFPKEYF